MIGSNEQWDEFITQHRWAVLTTLRKSGQPSSSVVALIATKVPHSWRGNYPARDPP